MKRSTQWRPMGMVQAPSRRINCAGGDFLTRWAAASAFFVQDPVDQDLFLSWIKELFLAGGVTTRIGAVEAAGEGTAGYPILGGNCT